MLDLAVKIPLSPSPSPLEKVAGNTLPCSLTLFLEEQLLREERKSISVILTDVSLAAVLSQQGWISFGVSQHFCNSYR